ncbi:MAG: NADH-quinone oxidoreductase subunit NuoG [Nitrospirota bacterium]
METIELTINGKKVSVPPKTTILQAAQQNGIYIPHLCYDRRLTAYGGCRVCLVEVEGSPKLLASCSTPVTKDMAVHTESEKIAQARKTVLELLLIHHPLDCPVCDKAGECELQDMAFKYGPSESRFKGERKHGPELLAAPLVERNPNRCILCGKCVRICGEHQGVGAINLIGRGFKTIVSPAFEETLDCEFCGQCIDVCPVGALGSKPYRYRSRVWFMEDVDTVCSHCGSGCTLTLGIREGRIIRSRGLDGKGISRGDLCGKGRFGFDYLYSEKRLTHPLVRRQSGELEEASWDEALRFVADRLAAIKAEHGPEAIGAIGSPRCTVEDNYMLQRFVREAVGSPNLDSAARFGYAKAQEGIKRAFGLNALPIGFDSPLSAQAILVVDSDVTSTHPVFGLNVLRAARDFGARLIVLDPKATKLARHGSEWLRMRPGTAVALLNGMMKVILAEGLHQPEAEKLEGFAALRSSLESYSAEEAAKAAGVSAERLAQAARDFAAAGKRLLVMTLNDSENTKGTDVVLAAANLLLLLGEGPEALQLPAEFCNTLGMFEAGVRPDAGPGHRPVEKKGMDLIEMLYGESSSLKALYVMGENPVISFPRAAEVEKRLRELDLLVVQDIIRTDTAKMAHVVLPAAGWSEEGGTFVGSAGIPQRAAQCTQRPGEVVADWRILRNLARYMQSPLGEMGSRVELQEEISAALPFAFSTAGWKGTFHPVSPDGGEPVDEEFPFAMVTGILMQHSGSLTTISKSLGTVVSDAYVQINDRDARRLSVADEGYVRVASRRGEVYLKARVTDEVPEGMLFVPAHFPHARVNALTYPPANGTANMVAARVEPA